MELLILVPTEHEFRSLFTLDMHPRIGTAICGAGLVSAATNTAKYLSMNPPKAVLLLGICGAYANSGFPIGTVVRVESSHLSDFGAYDHDGTLLSAEQLGLGLATWNSSSATDFPIVESELRDRFLKLPATHSSSVQGASGTDPMALDRARIGASSIEEMEGSAVLSVAQSFGVPVFHVRAVSNRAGLRNRSEWKIDVALNALHQWLHGVVA